MSSAQAPTTTTTGNAVPPSVVADHPYPNVPETTAGQQAATAPGAGGVVDEGSKLPFKEQVNGYAKKFAGTIFRNEDEKKFGEAKLEGNA